MDCHPQAGKEMKDVHPLLALSPKAFNERTVDIASLAQLKLSAGSAESLRFTVPAKVCVVVFIWRKQ
jgi:hypothetical protein